MYKDTSAVSFSLQQSLIATACKFYHWEEVDPYMVVSDSILGKFRREFQSHQLSVFPVVKVKSAGAASVSTHEVKRQRLADRIHIVMDEEGDEATPDSHYSIL